MFNILKKIIQSGYNLFWREKTITLVSIMTTIIVSFFIWSGILIFYFFNQTINFLQERLDFSVYFRPEINRAEIIKIQKILENFPGVIEVKLITQEEALEKFRKEVRTNPVISRALTEVNINPLVDYLIIKAKSSEVYPKIANYLERSPYKNYIDYISYYENQRVIEKIISFSNKAKVLIIILVFLLLIFSALIIFNVILVSIYSQKDELEVLRLVGANNWFIRLPFLIYSLIFSFVAYLLFLVGFIFTLEKTENFWPGLVSNFQPISFLYENFFFLNIFIFFIILIINWVGTFFALEKYLKI